MAFILSTWNKAEHQNKFQKIKLCIVNGSIRLQVASQAAKKKSKWYNSSISQVKENFKNSLFQILFNLSKIPIH